MIRKCLAITLSAIFLSLVCSAAFAADVPSIAVSSAQAKPGDTVTIRVSLANNPGINTFTLGFSYDTSRMTLLGVTPTANLGGQFVYAKKAVWLNGTDSKINGDILNLSFKVAPSAKSGETQVTVTYSPGDISNYSEQNVNFKVLPGSVTINANTSTLERIIEMFKWAIKLIKKILWIS